MANDAARVASYLQVSEFPSDMRAAIDPSIDPVCVYIYAYIYIYIYI